METALKTLGWSKAELARRLGVMPSTVSAWRHGAPQYVSAYLALALELKTLRDQAGAALDRTP